MSKAAAGRNGNRQIPTILKSSIREIRVIRGLFDP